MRLDKLLLFSSALLALVIVCHAMQDIDDKSKAYFAQIEAHNAAAEEYFVANNKPMAIVKYTLVAETCALDAIAFQQNDETLNAIKAYMYAAVANSRIAVIARSANLLSEAIEASLQEAQLYKQAAQLCKVASDIEAWSLVYTRVARTYARIAAIYREISVDYNEHDDLIFEASAWLMAASAFRESAKSFRNAGDTENENGMHRLVADAYTMAANIFRATRSFSLEAKAWIRAAEAETLSALTYTEMNAVLDGAQMYTFAARNYMGAAKAYKNAANPKSTIEAYQQAVTWRTIAAQIYHDARAYKNEAMEYLKIAHHYLTLNEHAQAGAAFELGGQAYRHAQDYPAAVTLFEAAEKAYAATNNPTAVQRVKSAIVTCDLNTRVLYHEATVRLDLKRTKLTSQIELHIRRSHLLQDSYYVVMALKPTHARHARFKIVFLGEMGEDRGGLSREWFSLLAHEMISPTNAFFVTRNPIDQTCQPNPKKKGPEDLNYYRFFGRVLALAINSDNLVPFRLTDALLKHMLKQPVVFEDLCSFDPTLYRSYVAVKRMPDLSDEGLFFSVHTDNGVVELCPDGNNVPLTLDNRDEYMGLVTNYYLTAQIQAQLNAFLDGFHRFVHRDCIATLNTRALAWLINGESTLSIDDWEHNTLYEGCSAASLPVIWFWNTVRSFSPEQHAKLLQFVTGSSLVPLGGFSKLDPKFTISDIKQEGDHAPSAVTCFHKLNLPTYSSETILRDKLLYAIEEGRVSFGFV